MSLLSFIKTKLSATKALDVPPEGAAATILVTASSHIKDLCSVDVISKQCNDFPDLAIALYEELLISFYVLFCRNFENRIQNNILADIFAKAIWDELKKLISSGSDPSINQLLEGLTNDPKIRERVKGAEAFFFENVMDLETEAKIKHLMYLSGDKKTENSYIQFTVKLFWLILSKLEIDEIEDALVIAQLWVRHSASLIFLANNVLPYLKPVITKEARRSQWPELIANIADQLLTSKKNIIESLIKSLYVNNNSEIHVVNELDSATLVKVAIIVESVQLLFCCGILGKFEYIIPEDGQDFTEALYATVLGNKVELGLAYLQSYKQVMGERLRTEILFDIVKCFFPNAASEEELLEKAQIVKNFPQHLSALTQLALAKAFRDEKTTQRVGAILEKFLSPSYTSEGLNIF